ncbi:MAG TPA: NAD(P)/FAD-dependent oxidoreductase [Bacteroidales bacterium]|nr:NAD(P)/FAD-dependent oxidoreductase [Bacteroidales bacterium]
MISHDAEVLIIGAGPAGAVAAYDLAVRGIRVLVLERSSFPRYKVCGGGLTHKVLQEFPFDVLPVVETTIRSIRFSRKHRQVFTRSFLDPVLYCTMRSRLDEFLLGKALAAGAGVIFEQKVTRVAETKEGCEVSCGSGTYRSSLVIGADGASGITSVNAGLRSHLEPGLAWEAELKAEPAALEQYRETVFLDWGTFPGGYAWLFPKRDHVSVGVGGPARLSQRMLPYYERFIRSLEPGILTGETISRKAWPIPVRTAKSRFHAGRILVTGDAGGLSDPLTGEGIYYAVKSARMAASACADWLDSRSGTLDSYSDRVNEELMKELLEAGKIRNLFNAIPGKIHGWVESRDRVWGAMAKVLRGERNYRDVKKRFGRWSFLWGPAISLSLLISRVKERIYMLQR